MLILVKLGGELVDSARLSTIAADVAALQQAGHRVLMVHGGGPQVTALSERLGIAPNIVGGRRITDGATLDVVKMVVAGRLNVDLCGALRRAGVRALGLHGAAIATKRPPRVVSGGGPEPIDFGFVGDVTGIDRGLLDWALADGRVPVLACLGAWSDGTVYNINADTVANRVAVELGADVVVLVTNTDGVRRDFKDPTSRIPQLTLAEARAAIAAGAVSGGMIPKLEESFAALEAGVQSILILDGELASAIASPGTVGTRLVG